MSDEMILYNSNGRKLEPFYPIEKGEVKLYCCGPTVYNFAHIGNLRAYVFEDTLRRTLEYLGYRVNHVMNITDVGHLTGDGDEGEDKIIKSAREKGMSVWDISRYFTDAFLKDIEELNIKRPTTICKATEHVEEMIELIKRLEKKGFAYQSGGNIYFDILKLDDYGKMALLDKQELRQSERIQNDSNKRNRHDFVLWFTKGKFENQVMQWDSPWGKGYPGWHIECSAMSMKYLGERIDIHCGGIDHIPVHHTNEIAQSEAATGAKWVNYWLHNEFLLLKEGKMAKSKGNIVTLSSLKELGFSPFDYRYFLLNGHYRSQMLFSEEALKGAQKARERLFQRVADLKAKTASFKTDQKSSSVIGYRERFKEAVANDLNTPKALGTVWELLKDDSVGDSDKLATILDFDRVLGLNLDSSNKRETSASSVSSVSKEEADSIELLIAKRDCARKEKNFILADQVRDQLAQMGVKIKDTAGGTVWEKVEEFH